MVDYVGQKYAELCMNITLVLFAVLGWVAGFILQDFLVTLGILGLGVLLSTLLYVPDWPFWNTNPVRWRKSKSA